MVRILVADDHDLVRETIAAYLEAEGFETVILASEVEQALLILAEGGKVDLVLADYDMPGIDGLAGLARLIAANAPYPVALISGAISADMAAAALVMGARGVVPKTLGSRSMVAAVAAMLAGEVFAPLHATRPVSDAVLSPRELDVLRGICAGKSNKEIARDFGLQEVTVKLHVKTMSRKLEAKNRTHAAMMARDRKLV
ncbi:MAG: response regulator transcription factor [Candidatus Saccharibacteria bacterium]|nr:response regulator transcription factor [Pseudorhodobacter sp.]